MSSLTAGIMSSLTAGIALAPLLVDIKADVAGFKNDMQKATSVGVEEAEKLSTKLTKVAKVGDSISGLGSKLTMGLTLPLVGLGAAIGNIGMDYEAQMSRVKAISGATGREFEKLDKQAIDLGASTAFSATEAAQGMENLASAGFGVNEIMEAMPGMMDLAASSGEDLASSADIAASTLRGFGLEASQAAHVADVLAKNSADTNAAVSDTGEAMKYIAPVAHSMGLSLEEVTASIGIMANAGIKGSEAGTTLRTSLSRLADPSKEAAKAMDNLSFTAFDAQGNLLPLKNIIGNLKVATKDLTMEQKQQAISTIFGTEAMSGMLTLVDAGPEQLEQLTNSLKNSEGAAKDMAKTMQDNAKSSVEQMVGSLETAAIKIEKSVAPTITKIANYVGELADKFANLSEDQQENILKWTAIAIAAGPVLKIFGGGISTVATLGKGILSLSNVIKGTTLATETLTTVGGLAGGASGVGGMVTTMGSALLTCAPLALGVAAVGTAIYAVHENAEYMNTSIHKTTEELPFMQSAMNALNGHTIKSKEEMQEMGLIYTDWNENVSPETRAALEETATTIANLNLEVEKSNVTGEIITEEDSTDLINKTDKLCKDVIQTIQSNSSETTAGLKKLFEENGIQDYEQYTLDSLDKLSIEEQGKVTELNSKINVIYANASKEKRKINDTEKAQIQDYYSQVANIKLNSTAKTQDELLNAQATFNVRLKGLDEQGVSDLLQSQAQARDEKNAAIDQDYDTQIEKLKMNWDKKDYAEKLYAQEAIKSLEEEKQKKIDLNNQTYQGYLKTIEEKYPEIYSRIDYHNGLILNSTELAARAELAQQLSMFQGLDSINETGYYKLYNQNRNCWENVYVDVDTETGKIKSVWNQTTGEVAGNPVSANVREVDTGAFDRVKAEYDRLKGYLISNPLGTDFYIKYNQYSNGYGYDANGNAISHYNYNGQDYVPYDGYTARLHKGERVLTAKENEQYNNTNNNPTSTINFNGNYNFNDKGDIDYFLNQAALKLKGAR